MQKKALRNRHHLRERDYQNSSPRDNTPLAKFGSTQISNSPCPSKLHEQQLIGSSNLWRVTSAEKRALDESWYPDYNDLRHAAEVHRQVRQYARKTIKPGMTMTEIAELIENGTRALVEEDGLKRGIGFPTGLSLNHCAAHYTPNAGDKIGSHYILYSD